MQSICMFNQPRLPFPARFAACGYNKHEHEPSSAKNFFFRRKAIMYCTCTLQMIVLVHTVHAMPPDPPPSPHLYLYIYVYGYLFPDLAIGGFFVFFLDFCQPCPSGGQKAAFDVELGGDGNLRR